ncbi:uncharacterized protein CDAR_542481 [Caerostris darwini]|uniref:RNase H type-1 domain-containing protein n=1 Tax=Caerostris darwini TaxID=1538125 RepID=A0AAV4RSC1_9ARAC|nr:uncharacterized protein CDAR_542481 [Caerostris darwini]
MKVLQLQRIGLLNVTKCYSSVPTDALHVLAGIPPLDLKLKHDLRLFQLKHCNKELCSNGIVIQPTSLSFLKPILPPWNCASFPWTPFDENLQGVLIFTDGSKMDNKVAGAFVVYHNSIETDHSTFRLSDHATVYMAELFAIYKAIEFLSLHHFEEAHIITDSRSVLQALHNVNNIDPLVTRLKNIICCLKCKLHLHWIKAHVGFAGNERADFLANLQRIIPPLTFWWTLPLRLLKGSFIGPYWQIGKIGGTSQRRLITGHGTIGAHQARLFQKSPSCQCGHPTEDRHHIIYQCPLWNSIRSKHLPPNHNSIDIHLIFANSKSKMGLIEIMKIKLQSALQSIEDEDET